MPPSAGVAIPWAVYGQDAPDLAAQARRLLSQLEDEPRWEAADVGRALVATRDVLAHRAVVLGHDRDEHLSGLTALSQGSESPFLVRGSARDRGHVAFVFPGQGSQWVGMGAELLETSSEFREQVSACDAALAPYLDWSVTDLLRGRSPVPLEGVQVIQPVLFAMMVSLAALWRSYGVEPAAVAGTSMGEIAAAYVSGGLSLEDAARVVARWSRSQATLSGRGEMAAVQLPPGQVASFIAPWDGRISIAAINGPTSVVISGDCDPVREFLDRAQSSGIRAHSLATGVAAHSPAIDELRDDLLSVLPPLAPRPPDVPFISTVTGDWLDSALSADYWHRNLRHQIRFEQAIRTLAECGHGTFIEISPHPVLAMAVQETTDDLSSAAVVLDSVRRDDGSMGRFLQSAAKFHVQGGAVDWTRAFAGAEPHRIELLPYDHAPAQAQSHAPVPAGPSAVGSGPDRETMLRLIFSEMGNEAGPVSAEASFWELGFDSVTALDFRDRLGSITGLHLPATLVFDYPSPAKLAGYLAEQLSTAVPAEAERPERANSDEPIAIVGMSCRFPGGVQSPDELWNLVDAGRDAISDLPSDRGWDINGLYDPERSRPGRFYQHEAGLLRDVDKFDASFFKISPNEALMMDPQQRLLLETSWEALEVAGIMPGTLQGSRTGVFVGSIVQEYGPALHQVPHGYGGHVFTGNTASVASGRIAYALGLEGPAVTVDTACSSSLVAMHLACQALRGGECDLALAGGVTVMSAPGIFVEISQLGALSPDGRCKAFSASADGFGLAEGAGLVLLERLSDARRHGHQVLALIRGSAINQDGASNGLTAPNGPAQQRVIHAALATAGLTPADIDAVEAHGTGTTLGDPIEAQALLATYGTSRPHGPLLLGSVKSNIGHTQAAAGIAGVIKMVQAITHHHLPPTLHATHPTPHIDWDPARIQLLTTGQPWNPPTGRPRRAAISSFGISGTNAHLILEQPPTPTTPAGSSNGNGTPASTSAASTAEQDTPAPGIAGILLWPVSAKTQDGLRAAATRLHTWLTTHPDADLAHAAAALARARTHFPARAVITGTSRADLETGLTALAAGQAAANLVTGIAAADPSIAVLFPGQGAQYPGMAAGLYQASPVYAAALDQACALVTGGLEPPLRDVLLAGPGTDLAARLTETAYTQPAVFAAGVATWAVLQNTGLQPAAMAGHSAGEITAACAAGALTLDQTAALITARSQAMAALPAGGAMISIAASEADITPTLTPAVSLAAVNGPAAVVISGDTEPTTAVAAHWDQQGRRTRTLAVSHAFHSARIDAALPAITAAAAALTARPPRIPLISALDGQPATASQLTDPGHWARHARDPVRFAAVLDTLAAQPGTLCLEAGPGTTLTTLATTAGLPAIPTTTSGQDAPTALATAIATAHTHGATLDWATIYPGPLPAGLNLPTYPFQRQPYWLHTTHPADPAGLGLQPDPHPLLAAVTTLPDGTTIHTGRLTLDDHPWLAGHTVHGTIIAPGTALADLALHAAATTTTPALAELTLHHPLTLTPGQPLTLHITTTPAPGDKDSPSTGTGTVVIATRPATSDSDQPWTHHATATLTTPPTRSDLGPDLTAPQWPPAGAVPVALDGLYDVLAGTGLNRPVGSAAFEGLKNVWRDGRAIYADVGLPGQELIRPEGFIVPAALLDYALQAPIPAERDTRGNGSLTWQQSTDALPAAFPSGSEFRTVRLQLVPAGQSATSLDMTSPDGRVLASIASLKAEPSFNDMPETRPGRDSSNIYRLNWQPVIAVDSISITADSCALVGSPDMITAFGGGDIGFLGYPDLSTLREVMTSKPGPPELLIFPSGLGSAPACSPDETREMTAAILAFIQEFLADDRFSATRLIVTTRNAVAAHPGEEIGDLAAAAVWGFVRSAQAENPHQITIIDCAELETLKTLLPAALTIDEPQLAIRGSAFHAPRLDPVQDTPASPRPWDPDGTVLITGGTGSLGGLVTRYLAAEHDVRHLLLISRHGQAADRVGDLQAEVNALGAQLTIATCNVADQDALGRLIASVPAEHPLTAVIHAAGVIDDGVIAFLDRDRLAKVLRPKVDGAWNLHNLTKDMDLAAFLMFSSVAATFGSAGQANYAAANAYLDALAYHRRANGLTATSLAWGPWAEVGMASNLNYTERSRFAASGVGWLSVEEGLSAFGMARGSDLPLVVLAQLKLNMPDAMAQESSFPSLLRAIRPELAETDAGLPEFSADPLSSRWALLLNSEPADRKLHMLVNLVRTHAAQVLGHSDHLMVETDKNFRDIGFDSLSAVRMRNSLNAAFGLRLPATFVFDHPTPRAVAERLLAELTAGEDPAPSIFSNLEKVKKAVLATSLDEETVVKLTESLQDLTLDLYKMQHHSAEGGPQAAHDDSIKSREDIFNFIDRELGTD